MCGGCARVCGGCAGVCGGCARGCGGCAGVCGVLDAAAGGVSTYGDLEAAARTRARVDAKGALGATGLQLGALVAAALDRVRVATGMAVETALALGTAEASTMRCSSGSHPLCRGNSI